jgi:hypothetical protein
LHKIVMMRQRSKAMPTQKTTAKAVKQPEGVLDTVIETAKDLPAQVGLGISSVVEKVSDVASAAASATGDVVSGVAHKVGLGNKK